MEIMRRNIKQGLTAEQKALPIIKNYFNREIKQTTDKYSRFDFECDKYIYELKTRNCKSTTYPTTMIATDKIILNCEKKQYFLFQFEDGLYYIKYSPHKFIDFNKSQFNRTDRGFDINKEYVFIPIKKLKQII
jgi:hypothetical protein